MPVRLFVQRHGFHHSQGHAAVTPDQRKRFHPFLPDSIPNDKTPDCPISAVLLEMTAGSGQGLGEVLPG